MVNKLTQPIPDTQKEIAQKLKTQVTHLKSISIKKTQLQAKLDAIKAQYASMLQDTQELQTKLTEGQQKLKALSGQYMKAVSQSAMPDKVRIQNVAVTEWAPAKRSHLCQWPPD